MKIGLSICVVVLLAAAFYSGTRYGRSSLTSQLLRDRDTVIVYDTLKIPGKQLAAKPKPVLFDTTRYMTKIDSLIDANRSILTERDSLRAFIARTAEPMGTSASDSCTVNDVKVRYTISAYSFPLERALPVWLDSMQLEVPKVTITQTAEKSAPWYVVPAFTVLGVVTGILLAK